MEKIFYANKSAFESSEIAVKKIFNDYFGISSPSILRNEHGKPYFDNEKALGLYFSVSHTKDKLFIAVSDKNVGIDAEDKNRTVAYSAILKKFPDLEQKEIQSSHEFLLHWIAKESAVKWLGGTLSHDLQKMAYIQERLTYENREISAVTTIKEFQDNLICVCCEKDFSNAEWIPIP